MSICSNSELKVITGSALFRGATCCINRPAKFGLIASAVSITLKFFPTNPAKDSKIIRRSLIGTLSESNSRKTPVRLCRGTSLGTSDSTRLGAVWERLSKSV